MKTRYFRPLSVFFIVITLIWVMTPFQEIYAAGMPGDDTITYWVREALREDPRIISDISISTYRRKDVKKQSWPKRTL